MPAPPDEALQFTRKFLKEKTVQTDIPDTEIAYITHFPIDIYMMTRIFSPYLSIRIEKLSVMMITLVLYRFGKILFSIEYL